jgi:AmmeMemoRadiSam system protein A
VSENEVVSSQFSEEERQLLLALARKAVEAAARSIPLPIVDFNTISERLQAPRACFVTLHKHGELRGCTGVLVARAPLAAEVVRTAAETALRDPRFMPVAPGETSELDIEISVLTSPEQLEYDDPAELPRLLRPGVDGVTLSAGSFRATFLPQVWERVPDPVMFLDMLTQKMGLPRRAWLTTHLDVETYQAEQISEPRFAEV